MLYQLSSARLRSVRYVFETLLIGSVALGGWMLAAPRAAVTAAVAGPGAAAGAWAFALCHAGGGANCVVDGDTFWMDGARIRVADIDAPETHPSRCPEEARLGEAATLRLQALLSGGPVTLVAGDRDTDKYGRALRIAMRDGKSLGEQLVDEGLARRWTGRRQPWCALI